jgi:hypothetical protein
VRPRLVFSLKRADYGGERTDYGGERADYGGERADYGLAAPEGLSPGRKRRFQRVCSPVGTTQYATCVSPIGASPSAFAFFAGFARNDYAPNAA